jgi:hypothetical protein
VTVSAAHWNPPWPSVTINADIGVRRNSTYLMTVWLPSSEIGVAFPFYIVLLLVRATRLVNQYVNTVLLLLLLLLLLTAIELSLGGSTGKASKKIYTKTKQYKNTVHTIQNIVNTSIRVTKTNTHYKTHTYTHPHITTPPPPPHTHTYILQNKLKQLQYKLQQPQFKIYPNEMVTV